MLKWSVTSRRNQDKSDVERPQRSEYSSDVNSFTPRTRNKRRHSGTNRGRISLPSRKSLGSEQDKENQFTSTPIKSLEDLNLFDPFRDVSNLTPKDRIESRGLNSNVNRRASMGNVPNIKDAQLTPLRSAKKTKKRKSFLTPFRDQNVDKYANQSSQFFKHFETVDSHIGALPELSNCDCDKNTINVPKKTNQKRFPDIYAPTLPTFTIDYSPTSMKTTHCLLTLNKTSPSRATPLKGFLEGANEDTPCFKKPKIDHVNDFLHQITFLTSPEESAVAFDFNIPKRRNSVKISPLVKRFVDLRFSNEKNKKENRKGINDSSFINDLSLNQIVDAILDETDENYSDLHIADDHIMSTKENELNETHEENIMNSEFEKRTLVPVSINRCSPDSGFKSSVATENCHQLEGNFQCKCNNNNNSTGSISIGKTFINLDETYNERCVDGTINRKRPSEDLGAYEMETKRLNLDESSFALKRQKCVRRRKTIFKMNRNHNINIRENEDCNMVSINQTQTNLQHENFPLNDNSFESSIVSASDVGKLTDVVCENFVEKKNESGTSENVTPTSGKGRIRRCLLFESPDSKIPFRSVTPLRSSTTDEGLIQLRIKQVDGELTVHVIRAWNLSKHSKKPVNSYVKVYLSNQSGAISGNGETSQRTAVLADSSKPIFNHVFKLKDHNKHERLHIDVWHRDRTTRTSEFLGCTSFSIQNECQTEIFGIFQLLPQSTGRYQNISITYCNPLSTIEENSDIEPVRRMCDSHSASIDEMIGLDDLENIGNTNKAILSEQQKSADENLFLRYLELDPIEGPEAIPAATQRRATGIKNGRTPFTHTKRLMKSGKSGFGFSVVWTHPPRIERVEKGLPADRAGILPGDYLIFVDKHNVVMMPEIEILNLIRSYGSQLTLEIFRRNTSRNGSVPSVKRVNSIATVSSTVLPTPTSFIPRRPSTVCSTNTASVDCSRKKLHLPQVTFSSEVGSGVLV